MGMALSLLATTTMRLITTRQRVTAMRLFLGLLLVWVIAGCGQEAVNRPYTLQDAQSNTLFTAFTQRSPKYLRSEEHTSELQSRGHLVCRLLLEKKKQKIN